MVARIRRGALIGSTLLLMAVPACSRPDRTAGLADTPKTDRSPVKPMADLDAIAIGPTVKPSRQRPEPLHYYTNKSTVMIRRPSGYKPDEAPHVCVWWTNNDGFDWHRAGYFGAGQPYYLFEAVEDGVYGVRFVGPGERTVSGPGAERVYHVDTVQPQVEVAVEPEQAWYHVGQQVAITWRAVDSHLTPQPVRISVLRSSEAGASDEIELQRDLADQGTIVYAIPMELLGTPVQIQVDALDRAGNLGAAATHQLAIVSEMADADDIDDADATVTATLADADTMHVIPAAGSADGEAISSESAVAATGSDIDAAAHQNGRIFATIVNKLGSVLDGLNGVLIALRTRTSEPDAIASETVSDADNTTGGDRSDERVVEADAEVVTADASNSEPEAADGSAMSDSALVGSVDPSPSVDERLLDGAPVSDTDCPDEFDPVPLSAEATDSPRVSARDDINSASTFDLTRGNGLLIPMPATLQTNANAPAAPSHAWRTLQETELRSADIWMLPEPAFNVELSRMLEGQFLADHQTIPSITPQDPAMANIASHGEP